MPEEHTHISSKYLEDLKKKNDYLIGSLSEKGAFCCVLRFYLGPKIAKAICDSREV